MHLVTIRMCWDRCGHFSNEAVAWMSMSCFIYPSWISPQLRRCGNGQWRKWAWNRASSRLHLSTGHSNSWPSQWSRIAHFSNFTAAQGTVSRSAFISFLWEHISMLFKFCIYRFFLFIDCHGICLQVLVVASLLVTIHCGLILSTLIGGLMLV